MNITDQINSLGNWFHSIDLGNGVVTPGQPVDSPVWANVRTERAKTSYAGKRVLDLATFEGMWAFEAERMGASVVVADDTNFQAYPKFELCKQALGSSVIGFHNVPMHAVAERLDVYWAGRGIGVFSEPLPVDAEWRFEIIQHMGVFYHLMDPMNTLLQCRSLIAPNGTLLLETLARTDGDCAMTLNDCNSKSGISDVSVWWIPTEACLNLMLRSTGFQPISRTWVNQKERYSRICLTAKALPEIPLEVQRLSRNLGYRPL